MISSRANPPAGPHPGKLVRPLVQALHAYVPGEQPKVKGLIKLNTNENPYPPSPKVLRAILESVDGRLRLYPSPTADGLRERLARLHHCQIDNIIVGNGSDELLALATRAFVDPAPDRKPSARSMVQYLAPCYSLYPVLADIHGALKNPVPLRKDFGVPSPDTLREGKWQPEAALTFVTTPNAPSGRGYSVRELEELCGTVRGVIVLDEAYVDFGPEHAMELALRLPHVLVARTFSKGYSLCALRVGYFVGHPALIASLHKVRDSYNVNGLGQIAATATVEDLAYYRRNFQRVIATRERTTASLTRLGFQVLPSHTNFILVRPPGPPAREWLNLLRARKILVRWFDLPGVRDYLRISVGTDSEMDALTRAAASIQRKAGRH